MSRLEELNECINQEHFDQISDETLQEYCNLVESYFLEQALKVRSATTLEEQVRELEPIFEAQYSLMLIVTRKFELVNEGLREVAKDFDNKDSQIYAYLINKIRQQDYILQK